MAHTVCAADQEQIMESYLVASTGPRFGVLAQVFARTASSAQRAVAAAHMDYFHESPTDCRVIDSGAANGLWIEGSPEYIRSIVA